MEVYIRPANIEDCPAMLELVRELAAYEQAAAEVTVQLQEFIDAGFGAHPVWTGFVAELNNEVVGLAICYVRYSTWKGRRLYLEDLVVTESLRGQGIGKLLLDRVIAYGRELGYHGVNWQVLDWNEPAINFYRKYKGVCFDAEWINVGLTYEEPDNDV